jgi:hypothetical protein
LNPVSTFSFAQQKLNCARPKKIKISAKMAELLGSPPVVFSVA